MSQEDLIRDTGLFLLLFVSEEVVVFLFIIIGIITYLAGVPILLTVFVLLWSLIMT